MTSVAKKYDVVVVGAGNAALTAALAAASEGAKVAILEKAPEHLRGGNSYFTGGLFRFAYQGIEDISELLPDMTAKEKDNIAGGSYKESEFALGNKLLAYFEFFKVFFIFRVKNRF